jgi:FkbM family methyltransferase
MNIVKRKNPAAILLHCLAYWWSMRREEGVFGFGDAFMNWREVLLPTRFADRTAGAALAREAKIEPVQESVCKITPTEQGLRCFWLGRVTNNLHYAIALVFDPAIPHYYTTPPVRLGPDSVVVDVGACEGLFSYAVLRQGLARRAICFEPSARTADYLHQGAVLNGLEDRLTIEVAAVSSTSGVVYFEEGGSPEANRIVTSSDSARCQQIPSIALDDYCRDKKVQLGPNDLIKIDAEGADLDILRGAEHTIRDHRPQIAVTTYHTEGHAREILAYLKSIQPGYRFRIKGFTIFGPVHLFGGTKPRPVLLQASARPIP